MRFFFLLILLLFIGASLPGQSPDTGRVSEKTRNLYVLPLVSYSPETSLRVGLIGVFLFRPREVRAGTLLSSVRAQLTHTLRNQPKARISYEIFLKENSHIFSGFVQWQRFPLLFYGIGPQSRPEDEELYTSRTLGAQFGYLRKVGTKIFLGGQGIWVNNKTLEREPEGLLSQQGLIPGNDGAISAGVGVLTRFDDRDNNFNATRGTYFQSGLTLFQEGFGSSYSFTKLDFDLRNFVRVFQKHVLAFQLFGEYNWGQPPFELLALMGGGEVMRGHYEGRFRDKVYWATQMEYRLPLNRRDWLGEGEELGFRERWGLVAFAGVGTVGATFRDLAGSDLKHSLGLGIRFLLLPKERVNIRLDFGFGTQQPGYYLNVREAF